MKLVTKEYTTAILVEQEAFEGVKKIAATVAKDIALVTGKEPELVNEDGLSCVCGQVILCATLGKSKLVKQLAESGKLDVEQLAGKREVFKLCMVENPFANVEKALVIVGSDKRGTIYGMFTLSEYIGVSPLVFWGDAMPGKKEELEIGEDICQTSKEPSVKYRGFFINDEWPCFGNWVCSHYGGFNAKAYEQVFEFLLRMKGNYLWPAMWSASFPLDGPGSANEELADMYGVVMGYSHHEPCLRASEEWDKVKGADTAYGTEWNFYTNEKGLLNYWEDALKRSGKYENIITIGMRGERDTSMLGEQSTVEENIRLLQDIIRKQRGLIRKHVNEDLTKVPQLLALYKEVEQYFYGDENIAGLKDWDELDGVICMLCEDNFGHMRTLPTEEIRNRKGGFGMYYHFDYHGGPVSYEWVDSTPLSKTWEQMCQAYEYGVRDVWIVNVGDVKFHEVPLTYFLSLAYDYDKWGYSNKDSYREYTKEWVKKTFPQAECDLQKEIAEVFTEYIDINHMRRPESSHPGIYHPCHYGETDRMLARAQRVEELSEHIMQTLDEAGKAAYYSMIHFSAMASMNLLKLHLYAGKNAYYASQGRPVANRYARLMKECIERDRKYAAEFGAFKDGKWNGMQLAQHIGFTKWNEDGYRYPVICNVEPVHKPRMSVSRRDGGILADKVYGPPMEIEVTDFMDAGCDSVVLEIDNQGIGSLHYNIEAKDGMLPDWLTISTTSGDVEEQAEVVLSCAKEKLPKEPETVYLLVRDGDTTVSVKVMGKAVDTKELPVNTFLPGKGVVTMGANHFCDKQDTDKGAYEVIEGYGKYGVAVKVFPSTASFTEEEKKPSLRYRFVAEEEGEYQVELLCAPTNSPVNKQSLRVMLENSQGSRVIAEVLPADFRAGENSEGRWNVGVLNQIRVATVNMPFAKGVQELSVSALEAGVVLEQSRVYKAEKQPLKSYIGPEESEWTK